MLALLCLHNVGLGTETVAVAVEKDALAFALGLSAGLNPLAHTGTAPQGSEETGESVGGIVAVVLAHDLANGIGGLVGVVEGDGADVVVQDVSLSDTVHELATNEAHLAIDSGSGTTDVVPLLGTVVRK